MQHAWRMQHQHTESNTACGTQPLWVQDCCWALLEPLHARSEMEEDMHRAGHVRGSQRGGCGA
eukprot:10944662-Prorocentrum_lima.AAC.1